MMDEQIKAWVRTYKLTPGIMAADGTVIHEITVNPIEYNLPNGTYQAMDGMSNTGLGIMARSPWHFYKLRLDPLRPPERERAGQLEGQLAHCEILEPGQFDLRYICAPHNAPRRPTEAQWNAKNPSPESVRSMNWWADFNAQAGGKKIITAEQWDVAHAQGESVRTNSEVANLLQGGQAEVSAFWEDQVTGESCRCRPDYVSPAGAGVILVDVKTYSDASPAEFQRQVARKGYHRQDAFYSDGYGHASKKNVLGFVFIAVEDSYPFASSAVMLDDEARENGRKVYRALLDTYVQCQRTGKWPSYDEQIELISLPAWALT